MALVMGLVGKHSSERRGTERVVLVERCRTGGFFEEVSDAQIERLKNLQECIEPDFVLALLHARQIGLMNSDPISELDLSELALLSELPDFASDEFELSGLVHAGFVDFYAM